MITKNGENKEKLSVVSPTIDIVRELSEDPLAISGLSFSKEKYNDKIDKLRQIIDSNGEITDAQKKKATQALAFYQMALSLEIPASGLTLMAGNPYINTAGLLYKTHAIAKEHGGIKRISAEPMLQGGVLLVSTKAGDPAFFKGIVEFQDGTKFEDIGEASVANIRMSTIRPFLNSMAARRATNRAMRLATGVGLVSLEELESGVSDAGAIVEGAATEEKLITKKQMDEISSYVDEMVEASKAEQLDVVKSKISEIKETLAPEQLKLLSKVYENRSKELGSSF